MSDITQDQTALLAKFDRIAELRCVSASQLGKILYGNGRVRAALEAGTMTFRRAQSLNQRLDRLEAEIMEKIRRGEPISQRGRPKKIEAA